jgi:hypothetical protein
MATESHIRSRLLAACHGFLAVASDGPVGQVERPLFAPDSDEPDYIVLRTGKLFPRRPIVAAPLVEGVDPDRHVVYVRLTAEQIDRLPENLPLAI